MDDLKKIVGTFIKKDTAEINEDTLINNAAIPGSILIHRMYAAINKAGYDVKDYNDISNFGELLHRLNGKNKSEPEKSKTKSISSETNRQHIDGLQSTMIGIDIESTSNLPLVVDIREDQFYKDNFTEREIGYALLKPTPYETLAGIFCAKEAICKAQPKISALPFNKIEIEHAENGAPVYSGFSLSISHAGGWAVAVAVFNGDKAVADPGKKDFLLSGDNGIDLMSPSMAIAPVNKKSSNISLIISLVSIAFSLVLLYLLLRK